MTEIKKVTIISGTGVSVCEVGSDEVVKIIDCSSEFPDSIYSRYDAYNKENKLLRSIENCPVDIIYK